ncbi:MAG: flagellar basal body rod protein FlgB [Gammaproteobacteria bacterium]|nr:MAG: flagellar basal body rod protein FlgB [Gammaproteobacteria bacterium]
MLGGTEKITMDLVQLALNVSSLKQQVISNNIANSNTVGFKPLKVDFEKQLQSLSKTLSNRTDSDSVSSMIKTLQPEIVIDQDFDQLGDKSVRLDQEMADMTENSVHYQALIESVTKKMALLRLAINGGQR